MSIATINSADPKAHSENIRNALRELTQHVREDIDRVDEPRFQALLETTAEVLIGLETAYQHYGQGQEQVWRK